MKRLPVIYFFLLLPLPGFSQLLDSVELKAVFPKQDYRRYGPIPSFLIKIRNTTNHSINVPAEPIVSAINGPPVKIIADVIFLGNDSLKAKVITCNIDPIGDFFGEKELAAGQEYEIEFNIGCFSFSNKGCYKARFKLDEKKTGLFGQSNWIRFCIPKGQYED